MTCAVYRLYNARAELLYVGMTADPLGRFVQHAATQPWWGDVVSYHLEWHTTRGAAIDAEAAAILAERPMHNIMKWREQEPRTFTGDLLAAANELQRNIEAQGINVEPCLAVKRKFHERTVSNVHRTVQPSSWRCVLPKGHDGPHRARPSAHQAPWLDEEP